MTDAHMRAQRKIQLIGSIAAIAVVCVLVAIVCVMSASNNKAEVVEEPEEELGTVTATVKAEGYDKETSTPVSLEVYEGDVKEKLINDDETDDPKALFELAGNANEAIELEDIEEGGTYTVAVTAAPILEDGTVYEATEPQVIELQSDDIDLTFECTVMDLEEATEEEIEEATEAATEAAEKSDNKSASNAATNATKKATEKATSAKSSSGSSSSSSNKNNSSSSSSSSNKNNSTSSNGSSSGSGSNSSSSSGSNSSSGNSGNSSSSTHTHNWVAQTKTVHHDAVYKEMIVCSCGKTFSTNSEWSAHNKSLLLNDEEGHSYSVKNAVATTAYDETVTTGYKCSICGATK